MKISEQTTYPAVVGHILVTLRKQMQLEQAEVAQKVGLSQSTWSRVEKGQSALTVDQLAKAARALSTSPGEILKHADATREKLAAMNVRVWDERPERAGQQALAIIGGAVLAFLIAKAFSK